MHGDFDFPTHVVFGAGRLRELPSLVRGFGSRPLIVTDAGVLRAGLLDPVRSVLSGAGLESDVFDGVEPNPVEANVEAGVRRFREGGDFLIALGGGSAIDAAKAIRLLASHAGPLARYDAQRPDAAAISADLPPLVAVPTTAGTGSEVGRSTVITIAGKKTVVFSPHLIPTVALCDPELTLGMPPAITAGTGADALTHNVEAYFAKGYHPMCDAIALDGMARAMRWLPTAVEDGRNLEARTEMMASAMMGAVAFQKGLGVVHSLAHPLSTVAGLHHGTANALMLPHALRFNTPAIADRVAPAAHALGVPAAPDASATVEAVAAALEALFLRIGLPPRLRHAGVSEASIQEMTDLAMKDGCHLCNPRDVTRADMEALYRAAF